MEKIENIWTVTGAEGSKGGSVLAANTGALLAMRGEKVCIIDAHRGGVEGYFSVRSTDDPGGLFKENGSFRDLSALSIETGIPGLRLIGGGRTLFDLTGPEGGATTGLKGALKGLGADRIIVDAGRGPSDGLFDFLALSGLVVTVLHPDPASVKKTYDLFKGYVLRRLQKLFSGDPQMMELIKRSTDRRRKDRAGTFLELCDRIASVDGRKAELALRDIEGFRPALVVNMAVSERDVESAEILMDASKTYLDIEVSFAGLLRRSKAVRASKKNGRPFVLDCSGRGARADMEAIVGNLLKGKGAAAAQEDTCLRDRFLFGFNDAVKHRGSVLHVQTEVLGGDPPFVETTVFHDGRILFKKKKELPRDGGEARKAAHKQHRTAIMAVKTDRFSTG